MPKLSNHKKDEVYKSIMGSSLQQSGTEPQSDSLISEKSILKQIKKSDSNLDTLVHKSYYITKRHVKALKIRVAISDKPEEKDFSAIVRAALDLYLADTLKDIN